MTVDSMKRLERYIRDESSTSNIAVEALVHNNTLTYLDLSKYSYY